MKAALIVLAASVSLLVSGPPISGQAAVTAFTQVHVMGGTGHPDVPGAVILVRNGRIESVGPAASVRVVDCDPSACSIVIRTSGSIGSPSSAVGR